MLAYAAEFVYNQGCLCYRVKHEVRLLDVHNAGRQERVLNLYDILPLLRGGLQDDDAPDRVKLLQYADGIIVFRYMGVEGEDDILVVIDISPRTQGRRTKRLLFQKRVSPSATLFVRHSRSYLWYGIFTALEHSDGVWSVEGIDLIKSSKPITVTLNPFIDGDIGQSLCFEIYKDNLYAVSTQVAPDGGERFSSHVPASHDERHSSFYYWSCNAPRDSSRRWEGRLWRREHCEGPINEMWTDLSIRTDEITGRPVILECRREWPAGRSENHRTYYTQPLGIPEELGEPGEDDDERPLTWADDCRGGWTNNNSLYEERPLKRLRRHYHAEHEPNHDQTQRKEFISARTKYRTYNHAASTFIDLVNDPAPPAAGIRTQDRLRLRAVSRKRKCPIDEEGTDGPAGLLYKPTQHNNDGSPVENSEERFTSSGVHMWPAEDAPAELNKLLCPDSRVNMVSASADERSLIYSIQCPGLPFNHKALMLISFDPKIHFPTLTSLCALKAPVVPEQVFPIELPRPTSPNGSTIRDSAPLYEAICWGYWLR